MSTPMTMSAELPVLPPARSPPLPAPARTPLPVPARAPVSASPTMKGSTLKEIRESLMHGQSQTQTKQLTVKPDSIADSITDSMKEQNRILGDIELGLGHLHTTAMDINHELHSQSKIIHDIDTKMDSANTNINVANTSVSRLINRAKSTDCRMYILIAVLLIILAILIYVIVTRV